MFDDPAGPDLGNRIHSKKTGVIKVNPYEFIDKNLIGFNLWIGCDEKWRSLRNQCQ